MLLHADIGAIAIANWYRPGNSGDDHIYSFEQELIELKSEVIGFIVLGDLNIHHAKWLRYSNGNSRQGTLLKRICADVVLKQIVNEPTRENYLLDLCLIDLESCRIKSPSPARRS